MPKQFLIILFIAAVLSSCTSKVVDQPESPIVVKTTVAKRLDLDEVLELSGIVNAKPNSSVKLSPAVSGLLLTVLPGIGEHVNKGQIVATLQHSIQTAQLEQAHAAFDLAKANLDKANRGAREQELDQAKAALDGAKANWQNAHNARLRLEKLLKDDVVAGRDYDLALSQEQIAASQQASAAANLSLVKKGPRLEDRQAAQAQAAQAAANVHQSVASLAQTQIVSPISGIVAERYLNPGDQTGPNSPVVLIVDTATVFVQANFPIGYNQRLEPGELVQVIPPGVSESLNGTMLSVGVKVDPVTNTIPAQIEVRNEHGILKIGLVVRCRVVLSTHHNALTIPKSCLIASAEDPEKFVVNVLENNQSVPVQVVAGITSGDNVEIVSGLKPGQQVIENIGYQLPKGTPVQTK